MRIGIAGYKLIKVGSTSNSGYKREVCREFFIEKECEDLVRLVTDDGQIFMVDIYELQKALGVFLDE